MNKQPNQDEYQDLRKDNISPMLKIIYRPGFVESGPIGRVPKVFGLHQGNVRLNLCFLDKKI
jgi:hypothetical protein